MSNAQRVVPAFEVHELKGDVETTVVKFVREKLGEGRDAKTVMRRKVTKVKKPAGWMVYTAKGDSIRVRTKEDMEHLGFMSAPPLVDMETGDEIPSAGTVSLRGLSDQRTQRNAIRSAAAGE